MTLRFLLELVERAVKTFAQTAVSVLTVGATTDLLSAPWVGAFSAAGFAAILSIMTSIASAQLGDRDTPSLVNPDRAEPDVWPSTQEAAELPGPTIPAKFTRDVT